MNVLILSHKPPFPIIDGGCFAMTQFLKNISSIETIEQIEYFSIHTHKHPLIPEDFPEPSEEMKQWVLSLATTYREKTFAEILDIV